MVAAAVVDISSGISSNNSGTALAAQINAHQQIIPNKKKCICFYVVLFF